MALEIQNVGQESYRATIIIKLFTDESPAHEEEEDHKKKTRLVKIKEWGGT